MPAFKPQQRHLTLGDRSFHFVSYEAQPANPRNGTEASPAMWYLMVEGRRCPVLPYDAAQDESQVDDALLAWAEDNALGPRQPAVTPSARGIDSQSQENWWGPN